MKRSGKGRRVVVVVVQKLLQKEVVLEIPTSTLHVSIAESITILISSVGEVDSGCTNYMICDEELFKNLDKSLKSRVRIGNRDYLEVKEKGIVAINSYAGTKLISDVLFVPEIDQNLLSVGQLVKKGFKVMLKDGRCLILDSSGKELFTKYEMAIGLPILELNSRYKACLTGKKTRLPFKNSTLRAKKKLQLIHTNFVVYKQLFHLMVAGYEEAKDDQEWMKAMKEELEEKVYLLRKALYGLKQAPKAWNNKMDEHLLHLGFVKNLSESTLYMNKSRVDLVIVSLSLDDMLVTGSDVTQIKTFKKDMMEVFEMTNLCRMHYFLGMKIKQGQNKVFLC
ncbi:uncharacterized protein LOC128035450 [Gossypium raimondii]|uniref:uncharacterized protein LOC128035450 n=1 Tax=Gossypium raimondii TaxID=29730 RepID=UPI00227C12DB|nr:uncharacterized protein LOC128035450 [Gossypium raimondii]